MGFSTWLILLGIMSLSWILISRGLNGFPISVSPPSAAHRFGFSLSFDFLSSWKSVLIFFFNNYAQQSWLMLTDERFSSVSLDDTFNKNHLNSNVLLKTAFLDKKNLQCALWLLNDTQCHSVSRPTRISVIRIVAVHQRYVGKEFLKIWGSRSGI